VEKRLANAFAEERRLSGCRSVDPRELLKGCGESARVLRMRRASRRMQVASGVIWKGRGPVPRMREVGGQVGEPLVAKTGLADAGERAGGKIEQVMAGNAGHLLGPFTAIEVEEVVGSRGAGAVEPETAGRGDRRRIGIKALVGGESRCGALPETDLHHGPRNRGLLVRGKGVRDMPGVIRSIVAVGMVVGPSFLEDPTVGIDIRIDPGLVAGDDDVAGVVGVRFAGIGSVAKFLEVGEAVGIGVGIRAVLGERVESVVDCGE
jgi:hypothetical protein